MLTHTLKYLTFALANVKKYSQKFTLQSTHFKNELQKAKANELDYCITGLKVSEALTSELLQEEENNSKVISDLKEQWLKVDEQKGPGL